MKRLAIIPARSGSKRIPDKNIQNLLGKPLIAWTIEAALQANSLDRVIVSTDSDEIAAIAEAAGADIPFMRPAKLALDETPGIDPVLHALNELAGFEEVALLQPTSPMRTSADIDAAIAKKLDAKAPALISVTEASELPNWQYKLDGSGKMIPFINTPPPTRKQDAASAYCLNGAIYVADVEWIKRTKSFISTETIGYVMPRERSVDIDTPLDWKWAEFMMKELNIG